jgi:dipeptidyl-peptidase III
VNYIRRQVPGAIEQFDRDEKTYIQVQDYEKMRKGVGMLLTELMRIKAEGDYDAIKALVDQYAVHFQPALRDQVVARYKKLNIPTYWAGINAILTTQIGTAGRIQNVEISYPADATQQYLVYSSMYDKTLLPSHSRKKGANPRK